MRPAIYGEPMMTTAIKTPPALRDQVREHAAQHGLSASEVYRRAVAAYLARQRKRERARV